MHLPVLSLIGGRERSLCRDMGIIPVFIGVVLDHKSDLAFISIHDLPDDRTGRHAVRSLEIEELDNRDRSIDGAFLGRIADWYIETLHISESKGKKKENEY
jgi:hypothetical protein